MTEISVRLINVISLFLVFGLHNDEFICHHLALRLIWHHHLPHIELDSSGFHKINQYIVWYQNLSSAGIGWRQAVTIARSRQSSLIGPDCKTIVIGQQYHSCCR